MPAEFVVLPCPYCSSLCAPMVRRTFMSRTGGVWLAVVCEIEGGGCGARGPRREIARGASKDDAMRHAQAEATEAWNNVSRRASAGGGGQR